MAVKGSNGAGALDPPMRDLRVKRSRSADAVAGAHRADHRPGVGRRRRPGPFARRRAERTQRDDGVAEGDGDPGRNRSAASDRGLVSSINEVAASIEQVTANTASLAGFGRRDRDVDPAERRVDPGGRRHDPGDGDRGAAGDHVDDRDGRLGRRRQAATPRR